MSIIFNYVNPIELTEIIFILECQHFQNRFNIFFLNPIKDLKRSKKNYGCRKNSDTP